MIPTPLRLPLAALFLALLAGMGGVAAALHMHGKAVAARQQAQRAWADAQASLEGLPQRIALVHAMRAHLPEQQRRGFAGQARRLDWISALSQTQRAFALQDVTWRLEPSRPTALAGLTATRMHLALAPMTPAELGTWLTRLDALGVGLFTVEQCDWMPAVPPPRMQCTLNWWTLQAEGSAR
jgi:hypothetical protein